MSRDTEEVVFGAVILLAIPLLLGVFPQFFVYCLFLGAFVFLGWLTMLGFGLIFAQFLPWCVRKLTRLLSRGRGAPS